MLSLFRELYRHQAWGDAGILEAARAHGDPMKDERLIWTLHHMALVQRAFLSMFLQRPFDMAKESKIPESFAGLIELFRESHQEELAFVDSLELADLERPFDLPWIPGANPSLGEGLLQVVMHSQNHRGQCLTRLRESGAKPPTLDMILWIKDKPDAVWPTME
jgi:uncharacterized damage-inducible protein DinB